MRSKGFLLAVVTVISVLISSSCERPEIPTTVKVEAGPSFLIRGSGRLASFTVYAPENGRKIAFPYKDVASVVWQVQSSKGYFGGTYVDGLDLQYGRIPKGYKQTVPSDAQTPSVLMYSKTSRPPADAKSRRLAGVRARCRDPERSRRIP
jgi:hypothetical protein